MGEDVCKYCTPNPYGHGKAVKELISQVFNDKAHIHTYIVGDAIHMLSIPSPHHTDLAIRYSKCRIISFCPMCGRSLKKKEAKD